MGEGRVPHIYHLPSLTGKQYPLPSFSRQAQAHSLLANLGRYSGPVIGEYGHVRKMPLEAHARFHYTQGPSLALDNP